jgi:hypothetical protein
LAFPVTAHAPHRSPFLFLAEHWLDIVQTLDLSFLTVQR